MTRSPPLLARVAQATAAAVRIVLILAAGAGSLPISHGGLATAAKIVADLVPPPLPLPLHPPLTATLPQAQVAAPAHGHALTQDATVLLTGLAAVTGATLLLVGIEPALGPTAPHQIVGATVAAGTGPTLAPAAAPLLTSASPEVHTGPVHDPQAAGYQKAGLWGGTGADSLNHPEGGATETTEADQSP